MALPQDFTLSTTRLLLRCGRLEDIDMIWSATRHTAFNEGLPSHPPKSRQELIRATADNITAWLQKHDYRFTIVHKPTQQPIGQIGFRQLGNSPKWNLGYWIHPDFHNQGFATEAADAVLSFGFEKLNVSNIVTSHASWNLASQRVIEKLGFTFIRENDCGFIKQNLPVPEKEYQFLAQDYFANTAISA